MMGTDTFTVEELEARVIKRGHGISLAGTVTPEVVAELLEVSVGTLRNWRHFGIGPRWVATGRVRYRLAAIVDYLNSANTDTDAA